MEATPAPEATTILGRSGVAVTQLSFGGSRIAAPDVTDAQAAEAVDAAWAVGIRSFDTAPFYGLGGSERRLGAALRERPRAEYVVSTKVGRLLTGDPETGWQWDFSRDGIRRSLDASLTRLGLDAVDVALVHDPDEHCREALDSAFPALHELRGQGVIRAIGAGMNQSAMLERFARECDLDCVLVAGRYTLLDRDAETTLLPTCLDRGISVLAAGVLNSGVLAEPDAAAATYDYRPVTSDVRRQARALATAAAAHGVPLVAAALQFPLHHPAVASVLVGCRSADEVEENARLFRQPVPKNLWPSLLDLDDRQRHERSGRTWRY